MSKRCVLQYPDGKYLGQDSADSFDFEIVTDINNSRVFFSKIEAGEYNWFRISDKYPDRAKIIPVKILTVEECEYLKEKHPISSAFFE